MSIYIRNCTTGDLNLYRLLAVSIVRGGYQLKKREILYIASKYPYCYCLSVFRYVITKQGPTQVLNVSTFGGVDAALRELFLMQFRYCICNSCLNFMQCLVSHRLLEFYSNHVFPASTLQHLQFYFPTTNIRDSFPENHYHLLLVRCN